VEEINIMDNKEEKEEKEEKTIEIIENKGNDITILINKSITMISEMMNEQMNYIKEQLRLLDRKVDYVHNELKMIKDPKINIILPNQSELKLENFEFNSKEIYNVLSYRDNRTFAYLFKKFYIKTNSDGKYIGPIRFSLNFRTRSVLEYYKNGQWNKDANAFTIIDIIIENFKTVLLKVNKFDDKKNNEEEFMENQRFIDSLDNEKVRKTLINIIKNELKNII